MTFSDQPTTAAIACDMSALTPVQRKRHTELYRILRRIVRKVDELADGYALGFARADLICIDLAEFMTLEQRCCPFLNFSLDMPAGGPIQLRMTGPQGTKDVLREEFSLG